MKQNIVIIGAGEIGRALAKILASNPETAHIEIWDKDPAKVPHQKSLAEIAPSADFLFLCVPSWAVKEVLATVKPHLQRKTIVVSLSKGIDAETQKTMNELLTSLLPQDQASALLYGPMLAEEIGLGMMGVGVVGSEDLDAADRVARIFQNTLLRCEISTDVHGIALVGVLKNIYAVGLGVADALNLGGNFKGWFVQRAAYEMGEIILLLGGNKETAFGPAGLGDLVATGFSPYSSNRQAGDELMKTGECRLKSEGCVSLPSIIKLLGEHISRFPILQALKEIITQRGNAKATFQTLAKTR